MARRNLKKNKFYEHYLKMPNSYEQSLNGNLNWRFSNINFKEKETQHINLRTNQGYQPLHLEAKLGPYDLCFAPLNVSENKMVPMCNTQLDFVMNMEYIIFS